jgi:winged helix DNA-binding protein
MPPALMHRIARQRLVNQHLLKPTLAKASEVVALLGAVQAQDYGSAKWGLAQRTRAATDTDIEKEIAAGAIVRTHILRPTWHFVAAADIGWMLALSAPRVHAANAYWYRWLEVDDAVARRSRTVLTKALREGKQLTRAELGQALTRAKIQVKSPQRLACIVMRAELDGLICSGARRGKQFTYALLEELVPRSRSLEREEAMHELAMRYFSTRGPATADDFAWWSGLTKTDAKRAAESVRSELEQQTIDGRSYWFPTPGRLARRKQPIAYLLPNYDEYFVGFRDRGAFAQRLRTAGIEARTDALSGHILAIDGQIVGGWGRTFRGKNAVVHLKLLQTLTAAETRAVASAGRRFGEFLGVPVQIQ